MKIKLNRSQFNEGFRTILTSGSVVYTPQKYIYYVPESSVKKLEEKNIEFQILTDERSDKKKKK